MPGRELGLAVGREEKLRGRLYPEGRAVETDRFEVGRRGGAAMRGAPSRGVGRGEIVRARLYGVRVAGDLADVGRRCDGAVGRPIADRVVLRTGPCREPLGRLAMDVVGRALLRGVKRDRGAVVGTARRASERVAGAGAARVPRAGWAAVVLPERSVAERGIAMRRAAPCGAVAAEGARRAPLPGKVRLPVVAVTGTARRPAAGTSWPG